MIRNTKNARKKTNNASTSKKIRPRGSKGLKKAQQQHNSILKNIHSNEPRDLKAYSKAATSLSNNVKLELKVSSRVPRLKMRGQPKNEYRSISTRFKRYNKRGGRLRAADEFSGMEIMFYNHKNSHSAKKSNLASAPKNPLQIIRDNLGSEKVRLGGSLKSRNKRGIKFDDFRPNPGFDTNRTFGGKKAIITVEDAALEERLAPGISKSLKIPKKISLSKEAKKNLLTALKPTNINKGFSYRSKKGREKTPSIMNKRIPINSEKYQKFKFLNSKRNKSSRVGSRDNGRLPSLENDGLGGFNDPKSRNSVNFGKERTTGIPPSRRNLRTSEGEKKVKGAAYYSNLAIYTRENSERLNFDQKSPKELLSNLDANGDIHSKIINSSYSRTLRGGKKSRQISQNKKRIQNLKVLNLGPPDSLRDYFSNKTQRQGALGMQTIPLTAKSGGLGKTDLLYSVVKERAARDETAPKMRFKRSSGYFLSLDKLSSAGRMNGLTKINQDSVVTLKLRFRELMQGPTNTGQQGYLRRLEGAEFGKDNQGKEVGQLGRGSRIFGQIQPQEIEVLAVFDGHGSAGHDVSGFLAKTLRGKS